MSECEACLGHGEVHCDNCDGTGVDEPSGYDSCVACDGVGSVECSECSGSGEQT